MNKKSDAALAVLVSGGQWFNWVEEIKRYVQFEDVILEVGFGSGYLQTALALEGMDVYGLDESYQMAKLTCKRLHSERLSKKLSRADGKAMPFTQNTFNLVLSTFPSEYIYDQKFQQEVMRVLQPGGSFVALLGVTFNGKSVIDRFYRFLYAFVLGGRKKSVSDKPVDLRSLFLFPVEIEHVVIQTRTLIFLSYHNPID